MPTLETPTLSYPTPVTPRPVNPNDTITGDALVVELWDRLASDYICEEYGTRHPDQVKYLDYFLIYQEPVMDGDTNRLVKKVWSRYRTAQDIYNAQIKYVQEGASFPIYIRTYLVPRGTAAIADESPLTTVTNLDYTTGGTGYVGDALGRIDLIFTGGGGAGAAGYGTVSVSGSITAVWLTDGGDGYTTPPVVSAAGGVGLDVTAVIQRQDALLISQQTAPAPSPYTSLYDQVTRVYHTFPGPTLLEWKWSPTFRTYVKIAKTILKGSQMPAAVYAGTPGTITEYQSIDKNRILKIVSSVASTPANYTYPTIVSRFPLPPQIIGTPYLYYIWALSNDGTAFAMDLGLNMDIREGYDGPYIGRITEVFVTDPTAIVFPTLTTFNPQAHVISPGVWYYSQSSASATITNFSIPQTLHDEITFTVQGTAPPSPSGPGNPYNEITLPATVPPEIPATGSWIVISCTQPQPTELNLWRYQILEIQIPSFV